MLAGRAIGLLRSSTDGHLLLELAAIATAGALAVAQDADRAGCSGLIPIYGVADGGCGGLGLRLFVGAFLRGGPFREYDVARDGQGFVMVQGGAASSTLIAMHHVFDRLVYDRREQR